MSKLRKKNDLERKRKEQKNITSVENLVHFFANWKIKSFRKVLIITNPVLNAS